MSSGDLLSSTLNWPGRGFYGLKSSCKEMNLNALIDDLTKITRQHMIFFLLLFV